MGPAGARTEPDPGEECPADVRREQSTRTHSHRCPYSARCRTGGERAAGSANVLPLRTSSLSNLVAQGPASRGQGEPAGSANALWAVVLDKPQSMGEAAEINIADKGPKNQGLSSPTCPITKGGRWRSAGPSLGSSATAIKSPSLVTPSAGWCVG